MMNNFFLQQTDWVRSHITVWQMRLALFLLLLGLGSAVSLWRYLPSHAQPGANCSASFFVDQSLPNGARWQLCWEQRNLDGIVLRDLYYTPPGGTARRVLAEGSIAQVHVPYDDNSARFHDITDDGFGGANLNDLTPAECPDGVLLKYGSKDALCQQILPRSYAFKGLGIQEQGDWLSLFSVSTSGEYNYIPVWRLGDDGTLELLMGAAGKLQRFTTDNRYGWPVRADGTRGTSHIHNYYWRLDFDLGESGTDDVVEEFNYASTADNNRRTLGITRFATEAGRSIDPVSMRSWRIRDGSALNANGQFISYQLEPIEVGHRDVGPSYEPWTANDFYVTNHRECERYVSHNPQVSGCADNLAGFVNGENLAGADPVLWYGVTFHHLPRDEDEPFMHAHWNGFRLTPRDWHNTNPTATDVATCAVGDVTCDGQVDAADALFMLQYDVRLRTSSDQLPLPTGALYGYGCDVSGEGACNAIDALLTLQCSVGLANRFCATASLQAAQAITAVASPLNFTVGQATLDDDGASHMPLRAVADNLGALSAVFTYDPAWPGTVTCLSNPEQQFELATCHVDAETGVVRFSLISTTGQTGELALGDVVFSQTNAQELHTPLLVAQSIVAADQGGTLVSTQSTNDHLPQQLYLPLIKQ